MVTKRAVLRKNLRHADRTPLKQQKSLGKRELLSLCLVMLSLLGTALTLVGYGVALSVDAFGLPPESMFSSPFEIISLAVWGVLYFFNEVIKISFIDGYKDILSESWPFLACGAAGLSSIYIAVQLKPYVDRFRQRRPYLTTYVSPIKREDGPSIRFLKMLACLPMIWLAAPAFLLALVFLFATGAFLLSIAPYIGMAAGKSHIVNDVVKPDACMPLRGRAQRLEPVRQAVNTNYAKCVSLKTDRMPQDRRGRVVFSTSSSIVLFDPVTGSVVRFPTKDATIEPIDNIARSEETSRIETAPATSN